MTRAGLFRAVLAAAVAATLHAPPSAAAPVAVCPPPVPVMPPHPDARHVVLLATATPDTVEAGWGDVNPGPGERPRDWREQPVYGQVAHVAQVAGPGADGLAPGRVVLVPWTDACSTHPVRWGWRSFVWMRPGVPDAVVGRLRRREDWAGGVPTIDVLRTDLVRESGELPGAVRWTATADETYGFYATFPTRPALRANAWAAVEPARAWLAANPDAARRQPIRQAALSLHATASDHAVRAAPSPLAGTYRFDVSRTGGPTHVLYARTMRTAGGALPGYDTAGAVFPASALGYALAAVVRTRASALPSPRPGPVPTPFSGASMEIHRPDAGAQGADGSREFRGHLELLNVTSLFRRDPALREWILEWYRRWARNTPSGNPTARVVLRPDGAVEWSQVMELAPGRAITIRGIRLSAETLDIPADQ